MIIFFGNEVGHDHVQVGGIVKPDGWRLAQKLTDSDWDAARFRIPTGQTVGILSLAANVTITGRNPQRREGEWWVRVQIEFVGDGEPSTRSGGWLLLNA